MTDKPLKIGVLQGTEATQGILYQWSVGVYDSAFDEILKIVGEAGYAHFAMQVKEIATLNDPSHSDTVDIRPLENIFEIRDHGGVVGNINVRVFFGIDKQRRTIIILGTIKKQNNGPTPQGDKVRMRRRWRLYLGGSFGFLPE